MIPPSDLVFTSQSEYQQFGNRQPECSSTYNCYKLEVLIDPEIMPSWLLCNTCRPPVNAYETILKSSRRTVGLLVRFDFSTPLFNFL